MIFVKKRNTLFFPRRRNCLAIKKNSNVVQKTGGDHIKKKREQWDDGNNVVALEPGVCGL